MKAKKEKSNITLFQLITHFNNVWIQRCSDPTELRDVHWVNLDKKKGSGAGKAMNPIEQREDMGVSHWIPLIPEMNINVGESE